MSRSSLPAGRPSKLPIEVTNSCLPRRRGASDPEEAPFKQLFGT